VNNHEGVSTSSDGGAVFDEHMWPKNFSSYNAPARYGAFVNDKVWYVTGG